MKKQTNILQDYWENRLGIDYDIELQYYKNLCGVSVKTKHFHTNKKINIKGDILSYRDWENHILTHIKSLDINLLKEYSRFLNQKCRNGDIHFGSIQTIFIPYIICLVGEIISCCLNIFLDSETFKSTINKILFPISLIFVLWFIVNTFRKMVSLKSEAIYKYFYQDIKEIVDERIEQIKIKGVGD